MVYISEQEALSESAILSTRPEEFSAVENRTYMRLTHTVTYYGNALYRFSTDALWITMPLWQQPDSIGSCAPTLAIDDNTRSGRITYVKTSKNDVTGETHTETLGYDINQFRNTQNGDWYGSAGIFNFPYGGVYGDTTVTCSNLRAHYEFKAYLRYPNEDTNFNSVGTYCHSKGFHTSLPSISISINLGNSISIGFEPEITDDNITAGLLIHYIAN